MGFPTKRVLVDDDPAVQVLAGYEGQSGTLVNRGPNTVYLADTEAEAVAGASITDDTVDSFTLKVDEALPVNASGRQDELWARCAAAESATLHFIAEN
jgi:hypothetical protein